jgi:hypothetical protein
MDKVFEEIMKTDEGKEIVFGILSTALFYKQSTLKPHNPLVKQFSKEPINVQQVRKLLFQNLADFERLIGKLYTPDVSASVTVDDLTSGTK